MTSLPPVAGATFPLVGFALANLLVFLYVGILMRLGRRGTLIAASIFASLILFADLFIMYLIVFRGLIL